MPTAYHENVSVAGYNNRNLPAGGWTRWFNVDHPGGTGDYETITNIVSSFGRGCDGIPCRKPIAIKAVSIHWLSPQEEGISCKFDLLSTNQGGW